MSLLTDALALQHVPRWSVVRRLREQSVAEHSFAVAIIAIELVTRITTLSICRPGHLLYAALVHDIDESVTGDISSPAKRMMGALPTFVAVSPGWLPTKLELDVVKLADLIEAYTWLWMNGAGSHANQVRLESVGPRLSKHAMSLGVDSGDIDKLLNEIAQEDGRTRI